MGEQLRAMPGASGPLRRTTPMPPRPGGVAIATMVSEVENMADRHGRPGHAATCVSEMRTVFENASPTLSVVAPGTSATARWTMRRSYGFSGPSC